VAPSVAAGKLGGSGANGSGGGGGELSGGCEFSGVVLDNVLYNVSVDSCTSLATVQGDVDRIERLNALDEKARRLKVGIWRHANVDEEGAGDDDGGGGERGKARRVVLGGLVRVKNWLVAKATRN
jgi:hypothetical protein